MRRVVVAKSLFKALNIHNQPINPSSSRDNNLAKPSYSTKAGTRNVSKRLAVGDNEKKSTMDRGKAMTCDIVCERAKNKKEDVGEIFGNVHWCR